MDKEKTGTGSEQSLQVDGQMLAFGTKTAWGQRSMDDPSEDEAVGRGLGVALGGVDSAGVEGASGPPAGCKSETGEVSLETTWGVTLMVVFFVKPTFRCQLLPFLFLVGREPPY